VRALRVSPALLLALALAFATAAFGVAAFAESRAGPGGRVGPGALRPDLNASPGRHLLLLPGIGPSRARSIVEDRLLRGPFGAVGDLARVRGIGPGTASALAPFVRLSPRPREGPTGGAP
jgi:competence protein ComEA